MSETTSTALTQYMTDHGQVELSRDLVKRYLVSGDASKVTDQEVTLFIELCKYQRLNPFLREAYLIKYDEKAPAQMVTGKDVFVKRANEHPQCAGWENGVIVQTKDGAIERHQGSFVAPGETLVGGWAKVYRRDREMPVEKSVSLAEYNKGFATWKQIPATMICKVPLCQAQREAFPERLQDLLSPEEVLANPDGLSVEPVKVGDTAAVQVIDPPITNSERWRTLAARAKFHGKSTEDAKKAVAEVCGMKPISAWTNEDFAEIKRKLTPAEAVEPTEPVQ